jgi:hypothetical protein
MNQNDIHPLTAHRLWLLRTITAAAAAKAVPVEPGPKDGPNMVNFRIEAVRDGEHDTAAATAINMLAATLNAADDISRLAIEVVGEAQAGRGHPLGLYETHEGSIITRDGQGQRHELKAVAVPVELIGALLEMRQKLVQALGRIEAPPRPPAPAGRGTN